MDIMTPSPRSRGSVHAAGFVIDVGLIGETEARRRVHELWRPGSRLHELPDGSWLLRLTSSATVRAESAPGLPLTRDGDGWAAAGLTPTSASLTLARSGDLIRIPVGGLAPVPVETWADLSDLTVHRLRRLDRPAEPAVLPSRPDPEVPDLRSAAKLAAPSRFTRRLHRDGPAAVHPEPPQSDHAPARSLEQFWPVLAWLLIVVMVITKDNEDDPQSRLAGLAALGVVILVVGVIWLAGRPAHHGRGRERSTAETHRGGRGEPPTHRLRSLGLTILLRTPGRFMIASRHQAYLEKLTRQLDRGDWDNALRNAVGLGQPEGGSPHHLGARRRTPLTPTLYRPAGGSVVLLDDVIRLRELYQRATNQLEKERRVTEAAFVLTDLLDDPEAAVALLERHEHFRLAAELAEGRDLHPDMVVRLWWRAGDRDRATDIARSRGNFAGAVDRLSEVDPAAGHRLREDWVHDRQRVGDVVGAVDAAWPDSSLRHLVMADLNTSSVLDTPTAGYLFAHLVVEQPTESNLQHGLALLDDPSPAVRPVRSRFVDALAALSCEDPSADRRLSSAAMRSILRDSEALVSDAKLAERTANELRRRSDPLLRADLPPVPRHGNETGIVEAEAPQEAGQLPVFDAAALSSDTLLVAHGDLGVRLLTPDGRVRARWDVPTHGLVVADHGSRALLLTTAGGDRTIHVLDLVTRRVRRWTTLQVKSILPSYDGSVLATITEDGLAFVDVLSDSPRITWRELDRGTSVLAVGRSSTDITALLNVPWGFDQRERRLQVRIWSQPDTMTRQIFVTHLSPHTSSAVVASGRVVSIDTDGILTEMSDDTSYRPIRTQVRDARLLSSGDAHAVITPSTGGMLVTAHVRGRKVLTMTWPGHDAVGMRTHDGNLTFWDRAGRLMAVATHPTPTVTASLRTHL